MDPGAIGRADVALQEAMQAKMRELAELHCGAGEAELRQAVTSADYGRAVDCFKNALRLDGDSGAAEQGLERATDGQHSICNFSD